MELIELHHQDLASNSTTVITSFMHNPQTKTRPSLWRGSLSPDGSLFIYQEDVLQPLITVVDGITGKPITQIRWDGDLSPMPGHVDPSNERIVIPLAQWDARYSYGDTRKLLVASLKTGEVQGTYDVQQHISHVQFQEKSIVLIDHANQVGQINIGSPAIAWKPVEATQDKGKNHYLYTSFKLAGVMSKANNEDAGEFRLLCSNGCAKQGHFKLENGYLPVGLRGGMLVSEKYTAHELPAWLHNINRYCCSLFGRYLIAPMTYTLRYQDAITGRMLTEQHTKQRNGESWQSHRVAGSTRFAAIQIDKDHLNVEFAELFSFWTTGKLALFALAATILLTLLVTFRFPVQSRTSSGLERNGILLPGHLQSPHELDTSHQAVQSVLLRTGCEKL